MTQYLHSIRYSAKLAGTLGNPFATYIDYADTNTSEKLAFSEGSIRDREHQRKNNEQFRYIALDPSSTYKASGHVPGQHSGRMNA